MRHIVQTVKIYSDERIRTLTLALQDTCALNRFIQRFQQTLGFNPPSMADIDVESVLSQLSLEEKVSLTGGQ